MPVMNLIIYLSENTEKRWSKIVLIPTIVLAFILGTFLPCAIFGMGIGVTVLRFVGEATYPIIYFLIAGFVAFTIFAPNGETSFPGMLISLIVYIITVTIYEFTIFSEITIDFLFDLFFILAIGFILIGILFFVITFLKEKFINRK